MASWQARIFDLAIRGIVRRQHWGDERGLTRRARRVFGAPAPYARLASVGLRCDRITADGIRGEWLVPRNVRAGAVLYVHGGGFVSCSALTHRPITATLARLTRRRVASLDYRLAPEVRLPAAVEDVVDAYEWLCASGIPSSAIALVGDSAGGNLVLSAALRLRDRRRPMPACIVAFSPWTDLAGRGPSLRINDGHDAMFRPDNIRDFAAAALGGGNPDSPDVSPVYADLRGLPPLLLHVGSTELLLDDATRIHAGILASGGESTLAVYDGVPHGWQMLVPFLPEAMHSLRGAAAFIDAAFAGDPVSEPGAA